MKQLYGLIGHPVSHSISPFIHTRLFEISKTSADYKLFDISSNSLASALPLLNSLCGYNVTIPHKQGIMPFIGKLCGKANIYKSVNTIKNNGTSLGYNTDVDGFLSALNFEKINLSGNVTILGCGGVARIFGFESALHGCSVTLAVRNKSFNRAKNLASDVKNFTGKTICITSLDKLPKNIDLLINATPIGMFPNITQMPVTEADLKNCKAVFDAVYNPCETLLIQKAKSYGLKVASGISMLVFQAAFAHKIWNDAVFSDADVFQLILDSQKILKKFG